MSAHQLSAFMKAVKADAGLEEMLKGASDLDAAVAVAVEAGFDVSKEDWLEAQAQNAVEMSDEELEMVAGGTNTTAFDEAEVGAHIKFKGFGIELDVEL
jgi:predicted ribosomally synthesized peptide with nif11-like leader